MNSQVRSDNAMPILDDTTGSNRLVPCLKQATSCVTPCWVHRLEQLLGLLSQYLAALPGPRDESHGCFSQLLNSLSLTRFHFFRKEQQCGQSQPYLLDHPLHFFLHRRGSQLDGLLQQVQRGLHLTAPRLAAEQTWLFLSREHHDFEQLTQLSEEVAHRCEQPVQEDQ